MTVHPGPRPRLLRVMALWMPGLLFACDGSTGPSPNELPFDGPLVLARASVRAFTDVRVVDPANGTVRDGQVVLVREGRIVAVGRAGEVAVPAAAEVVDGGGGWLMPGLLDMHVHMRAADAEAYVRSGITRVRNMWGYPGLATLAAEIASGTRIGPTLHSLSPGLDGPPVKWPATQLITDPAEADALVQRMGDEGYRELKMYQDLSPEVYDAIVVAARARGMSFAGHKPRDVSLAHALASGQRSIEHLGGYTGLLAGSAVELARLTRDAGAWNCPTLAIQRGLAGASAGAAARRAATKALYDAGARLLVGTDAGIDVTLPGVSLFEEMLEMHEAGIGVPALIRMATVDAAAYLGLEAEIGAVAPGRRADLVLLAADPLLDLRAIRRPLGVHLGDGWIEMR